MFKKKWIGDMSLGEIDFYLHIVWIKHELQLRKYIN